MNTKRYTTLALVIALTLWLLDSFVHYYVFQENNFELIPTSINEFWMRAVIVCLIIGFGLYVDVSTSRLIIKQRQIEADKIYKSTLYASHHVLNNLLNKLQLFKVEYLEKGYISEESLHVCDEAIAESVMLINKLSAVKEVSDKNIRNSIVANSGTEKELSYSPLFEETVDVE